MSPDELSSDPESRPPTRAEVRARGMAIVGVTAILVVIVAAATSGGFALDTREGSGNLVAPRLPSFAAWILIPLLLVSIVASLTVLTQVVVGRQMTRPTRAPLWAQLVTVVLVVLSIVALQRAGLFEREQGRGDEAGAASPAPASRDSEDDEVTRSTAFGVVVTIVLVFVLLAILLLMLSVLRKERGRRNAVFDPETAAIVEAVDAGIDDLSRIEDPRAAVIACYSRMEAALATTGLARRPSEAPLEFLERILVEREVLDASARRLTTLFERARFSPHDIDEAMRAEAMSSLRAARVQIRGTA